MRARKWRAATDFRHRLPVAPNRLDQRLGRTTNPNQVWVADITYIPIDEGWLYLAGIKDFERGPLFWTGKLMIVY